MTDQATVVFIHGGGAGSWTWHLVVDDLQNRGISTRAPDLPTSSAADTSVGPDDDADFVRALLDESDGPFVLVGNSYGGYVITDAANGRSDVRHLVYASALMPDPGRSLVNQLRKSMVPGDELGLEILPDGRVAFDVETDLRASFNLAPEQERDFARRRLGRPVSFGSKPAVLDRVAWATIPSTYIVCTEDRAVLVEQQRAWARRATHSVELEADHCPQHSRPSELADIIERIVRGDDPTSRLRPLQSRCESDKP